MLTTEIRNFNEVEATYQPEIRKMIKQRQEYFENLFKKYSKDLVLKIDFNKDKQYRVNLEINMLSKTVSVTELDKEPVAALRRAFSEFKKAVKRQIALERKDYLYKRKRYRQQKWSEYFHLLTEDVEASNRDNRPKYSRKVKNALKSVQKYLKKRLKESGFTKKQIKAQMPRLVELIERKFYAKFDPKQHGPGDIDALLFGTAEEILAQYQNSGAEADGEIEVVEFEGDNQAPNEENYEPELYFLEDFTDNDDLIDRVSEQFSAEEVDDKISGIVGSLAPKEQAAVHLHFLENFDSEEISGITGLSEKQIDELLTGIKQKVQNSFEKEVK